MAAPRAKITNIKSLATRYTKGASIKDCAEAASPVRVLPATMRKALIAAGATIRPKGKKV